MLVISQPEEIEHGYQAELQPRRLAAMPLEQGQDDRIKATSSDKERLSIRAKLQIDGRLRDLAMFNVAIDSKLRGCDVVCLKVEDIAPHETTLDRATVGQKKTGQPVRFAQ